MAVTTGLIPYKCLLLPSHLHMTDKSILVSEQSIAGHVLHILVGYVDHPMGIQLLTYVLTIGLHGAAMYVMNVQQVKAR